MNFEELEDWQYLSAKIRDEGFHYCFKHYSSFEEIKCERFHQLRLDYLKSAKELEDYINKKLENGQ
jgi:hypothetical protein